MSSLGVPKAPKYQNKFAFAHNPKSKKTQQIAKIPNVGLCKHCHDIIEWRKKFRKYKPLKMPSRCGQCNEKKITSAYHTWCMDCARAANVCPKCLLNKEIVQAEAAPLSQEELQEMLVSVGVKERVRRRIWRLWENDKATDQEIKDMIFNYNPDAKEQEGEEEEEEEEVDEEEERKLAAAKAAMARMAARGPAPKPKASAPKPAAAAPTSASAAPAATPAPAAASSTSTAAAAQPAGEEDEVDDYLDDSEGDEDEEEGEKEIEQAMAKADISKDNAAT